MATRPAHTNTILPEQETAAGRVARGSEEYMYSDTELSQLVKMEVQRSQQDWQTRVALQREQSYRYYYGEPFGNERPGFSRHVSMEVFDSVEGIKSELMGAFTAGPKVLKFEEEMENDAPAAHDATDYVHAIFYKQNDGYNVLKDAVHDALVAKQCCIRVGWREMTRVQPEEFDGIPAAHLSVMAQDPAVQEIEVFSVNTMEVPQPTPEGVIPFPVEVASGRLIRKNVVGDVCVEVIPPEDVFITVQADDANKADTVILRFERTRGELIAEGFDVELVEDISWGSFTWDYQEYGRHSIDDTYDWDHRTGERERTVVEVFEAYIMLDMDGDGIPEPWKITIGGDVVLDKEQVTEFPLHFWSPYRISHKAIGMSVADITMDIQRTSSGFVRGVVDNIFLTNTSPKIANLELIRNPRDLIDNPIGAVINSSDPDAVKFIPQPQLNQATFQGFDLIKNQKEERTGLSRLRQGLNANVVSHQNSADLIDAMVGAGGGRISEMARSLAETLVKPVFCHIYKVGVENQQVVGIPSEVGYRVLDPKDWKPVRHNMDIHVALTPTDRMKHAGFLAQSYTMLAQDPQLAPLFGVQQKYAMITDYFEMMGIANPAYLVNPSTPQGQQALQQAAQQAARTQAKAEETQTKLMQAQLQKVFGELKLKGEKQAADAMADGAAQALDREEFEHKKWVDKEEIALEKQQGGEDLGRRTIISKG